MRKIAFILLFMLCSQALGLGTWPINYQNVSNPSLLEKLLRDRIEGIETDLQNTSFNLGTGKVFYVDSAVGNDTWDGLRPATATATLDAAVDLCTADRGDVIYVMQGHSETMGAAADEVDVDVNGVTIIGLGNENLRPLYDYTSDVTGAFAVGADNVTLINLRFHANVTDVNEAIDIEAGSVGVTIAGCVFDLETEGTDDFLECIDSPGAASDRLQVIDCQFAMGAGACNAAIKTLDSDYMRVVDNEMHGDYAVACINNITTASNHIVIKDNIMFNGTIGGTGGLNAQPVIELLATTSGVVINNDMFCNLATVAAANVGADMFFARNYYGEDEGPSAGAVLRTDAVSVTASADD